MNNNYFYRLVDGYKKCEATPWHFLYLKFFRYFREQTLLRKIDLKKRKIIRDEQALPSEPLSHINLQIYKKTTKSCHLLRLYTICYGHHAPNPSSLTNYRGQSDLANLGFIRLFLKIFC